MKTLIIHPSDPSTSFLDSVYAPIKNKTVLTGGITKSEVRIQIEKHNRVLMMGHGSPYGLFSMGQFQNTYGGYVIDETMVDLLKMKKQCLFLWCNADEFVHEHQLSGLYSGMFISEKMEAIYCGVGADHSDIEESNTRFVEILASCIESDNGTIYRNLMKRYRKVGDRNPVVTYNHQRLYYRP